MRASLAACVSLGLAITACAPAMLLTHEPTAVAAAPVAARTARPASAPTVQPVATPTSARVATAAPVPEATPVVAPVVSAPASVEQDALEEASVARVPTLDGLLDGLVPDGGPAYGLVLEDLGSGARTAINDGQTFPSASLYKLAVAWLVVRQVDAGTLSLDAPMAIEDDDAVEVEPRGGFASGAAPTVSEALEAMLSVSSNAAAHAFLRVLGRSNLNQEMDRIGLSQTRVPDDDGEAVTSAGDIARLLRLISTSPELSVTAKEVLARGMANIAPPDALRDTLPDSVGVFDKTGNLDDSSNVGALLETSRGTAIVVVVDSGVNPGDARAVIAQMGQIAYRTLLQ
jgi:beta-lactamase class A